MPFPITCGVCKKAFSIADDVFERKVRGRSVTIKCKQCHAEIHVDGAKEPPVSSVVNASPAARQVGGGQPRVPSAGAGRGSTAKAALPHQAARPALAVNAVKASAPKPQAATAVTGAAPAPVLSAPFPAPVVNAPAAGLASAIESAALAVPSASPEQNLWAVDNPDGEDRELTREQLEHELRVGHIRPDTLVWHEGMKDWQEIGQLLEFRPLAASALVAEEKTEKLASDRLSDSSTAVPEPPLPPPPAPAPRAPEAPKPRSFEASSWPEEESRVPDRSPGASFSTAVAAPTSLPQSPVSVGAAATGGNIDEWPRKSRAPLVVGVGALAVVAGVAFFIVRSSASRSVVPSVIGPVSATAPRAPVVESEPSSNSPSESQTAAVAGDGSTPEPTAASPTPNSVLRPPGAATAMTNAGFAEMFASGARGAGAKPGAAGPAKHFDANQAKVSLAAAAAGSAACRRPGGPTGKATVLVTFAPSGDVSSAVVKDAPFAGTATGECIAAALRKAVVPAFSGPSGMAVKVVSLQ